MKFEARVICDSVSPAGCRLVTMVLTYPRFIHSEVMTHRDRARNAASSRAIPWERTLTNLIVSPVVPMWFGSEKSGMQTGEEIQGREAARLVWLDACAAAINYAEKLASLGVHKSIVNRIVEPYTWITVVMTATEWKNFLRLRCHGDAEIHMQTIAAMARDAMSASTPKELKIGEWHTPFVQPDEMDLDIETRKRISVARCARVSYLTHEGVRSIEKDLDLYERLAQGSGGVGHWSPFEHVAAAADPDERSGPFRGWRQFRKEFRNENVEG